MAIHTLQVEALDTLAPDEAKAGDIFSRLGYGFAEAIADLVDNSIDAQAGAVHIRFVKSHTGIHSVLIADNGRGMNASELREAMRFGSRSTRSKDQLGKYGIGLKSASLSQAEEVTVLSRKGGFVGGRRWKLENVKQNWTCEVLAQPSVAQSLDERIGDVSLRESGTLVIWERLEHLKAIPSNIDRVLSRTIKELQIELGIRFHRFLESEELSIGIDTVHGLDDATGVVIFVQPLNPFDYDDSPHSEYPLTLNLKVGGEILPLECHVWPPKSRAPGYRLGGGKVALRQGFYFYRNNRLIQAGGWNKMRADDGEPHLSLARVRIELPAELDSMFKLDVTKSRLDPSPEFFAALSSATSRSGATFDKFLSDADAVYRRQKKKDRAKFPFIPGRGLPMKAQRAIASILREPGTGRSTKVEFKWQKLDHDEVVRVDSVQRALLLNSRYRNQLSESGSSDAPVLKIALMFLLQDELGKSYLTKVSEERLQRINLALIAAMKD